MLSPDLLCSCNIITLLALFLTLECVITFVQITCFRVTCTVGCVCYHNLEKLFTPMASYITYPRYTDIVSHP